MTTKTVTIQDIELALTSRSFEDFLDYVQILEPPTATSRGGIIKFEKWGYLLEFCKELDTGRLINVLKSRQLGFSWILAAYALWTAMYKEGANVLAFSQGQLESVAFLNKARIVHENLPQHLKVGLGRDNDTTMEFPSMKSQITALPSTEKAGRGQTATLVIQDEADFHDNLDLNYAAIKPTIAQGGQLIQCSTVNKKRAGTLFKEIHRRAPGNGFTNIFNGWKSRPDRDQAWYDRVQREAPVTDGMSPELYMEQEHPETAEEALRPSRVMAAFDVDAIESMQLDTKLPVETRNGVANIYQKHVVGKRYAAGSDTAHGTGADYSVTAIIDVETGYVVADIYSNTIAPEHFAMESVNLLEDYKYPIWAIEDNDWGELTLKKAQSLKYPRMYERRNAQGKPSGKFGWRTDARTSTVLWGELIESVRDRLITVPSKPGLNQFSSVIRNPDKDGRIEGMVGTHDDYPMAVGLAWQMRKEAYNQAKKINVITREERVRRMRNNK